MDDKHDDDDKRKAPPSVVNGTRVTVAFPFSKIALQEPSDDLRNLAVLVADLAEALAAAEESDATDDLRRRTAAFRDQLSATVAARQ